MRRPAGIIARVIFLVVLAVAVAWLVRVGQDGGLSQLRLAAGLNTLGAMAADWTRGPRLAVTAGSLCLVAGWIGGTWRARSQLRKRSLLLVDPRGPDMPFMIGVRHVGDNADRGTSGSRDADAAQLLLRAARDGRLSLWRHTRTDIAFRISPRQLRRIMSSHPSEQPTPAQMGALASLSLIRREVERLWPAHATVEDQANLPRINHKGL